MTDLDLLRRHEPILRFTHGELFFPTRVAPYVAESSLWLSDRKGQFAELVPRGALTLERLGAYDRIEPGQTLFLRFVQEPLEGVAYQRWKYRETRPRFHAPGRLARVGLASRVLDSLFSLSLFLRGALRGGIAAAAAIKYERIIADDPHYTYYGRVVREGGYIILQYFFFYVMNDWRSTFYGVNDHEADWEQIIIYLAEQPDGEPTPEWIAFASHDGEGDDLRRRWDDATITIEHGHPVVFVGAGSHAGYFERGEYLHSVRLAFLRRLFTALHVIERIWRNVLRQGAPEKLVNRIEGFLSVPFVDYARGDGIEVGPGRSNAWSPEIIAEDTAWAQEYRGLWGFASRDPLAGETAPGGPKFRRDGSVRRSWHDPLGWAGMHKVAPAPLAPTRLEEHLCDLEAQLSSVQERCSELTVTLPRLELEVRALQLSKHNQQLLRTRETVLRAGEAEANDLFTRRAELRERIEACRTYLAEIRETASFGDPQSHIQRGLRPQSADVVRQGRLAEGWAALSTGIVLLLFVGLMLSGVAGWVAVLALVSALFLLVEAILYRKLERLLLNVTVALAVITTGVLVYEFFWYVLMAAAVALAGLIITDNVRELRG